VHPDDWRESPVELGEPSGPEPLDIVQRGGSIDQLAVDIDAPASRSKWCQVLRTTPHLIAG